MDYVKGPRGGTSNSKRDEHLKSMGPESSYWFSMEPIWVQSVNKVLVLDDDTEDLVMGVYWQKSLIGND
jgi:hypothetical protein